MCSWPPTHHCTMCIVETDHWCTWHTFETWWSFMWSFMISLKRINALWPWHEFQMYTYMWSWPLIKVMVYPNFYIYSVTLTLKIWLLWVLYTCFDSDQFVWCSMDLLDNWTQSSMTLISKIWSCFNSYS